MTAMVNQKDQLPSTTVIASRKTAHPRVASLPLRGIHLLAISWYTLRNRTQYQEIPTAFGLGMTEET